MDSSAKLFWLNTLVAALVLAGCAGGGETGTGLDPKSVATTPVAVGTITNFGSVFVNGVEFFTTGSAFTVDGQSADESKLKIGMVVSVRGSVRSDGSKGDATHIEFADDAEGVVLSNTVTSGAGTLNVMGRTVNVDSATVFDTSDKTHYPTIESIPLGAVVEVSGLSATGGDITATRIELKKLSHGSEEIETKGLIKDFNANGKTFSIGNLTVEFSTADLHGVSLTDLAAGPFVEVKSSQGIVNNKLIASSIETKLDNKRIEGKKGDSARLEGVITAVNIGLGQVTVNGQTVSVPANVIDSLVTGQKLEVEGDFEDDGTLHVRDSAIKPREVSTLRVSAMVDAASWPDKTVTLLGKAFQFNGATIFKDECEKISCLPRIRSFSQSTFLSTGNRVQVEANRVGDQWVISKLVRTDPESDPATIRGTVTAVNGRDVVIGGITVTIPMESPVPAKNDQVELNVSQSNGLVTAAGSQTAPGEVEDHK